MLVKLVLMSLFRNINIMCNHIKPDAPWRSIADVIAAVKTINKMMFARSISFDEYNKRKVCILDAIECSHTAIIANIFVI